MHPHSLSRSCGLRILLVGADQTWSDVVHSAAHAMGVDAVHAVASGREAMTEIVRAKHPYSHVLLRPTASDDLIDDLHGLTSGEPGSRTALALLGPRMMMRPNPRLPLVARADAQSVTAALRQPGPADTGPDPDPIDVSEALARSTIEVRYQPVVRVADGACVSLEALARLNHPAHGMLPPVRFVSQAENAGLAGALTEAVAGLAFAELAGSALADLNLSVALNAPLEILLDPGQMTCLDARRAAAGVRRERIVFELTESRPVTDFARLREAVERIRAAGYCVAADDIGPAVPDSAALLQLPFSTVKLDIGVVRGMRDAANAAFLASTIDAARANGATVVAEGVEDEETWDRLAALGVDQIQGFLVSRPLPAAALPVWLETWRERGAQRAGALRGTPDQTSR